MEAGGLIGFAAGALILALAPPFFAPGSSVKGLVVWGSLAALFLGVASALGPDRSEARGPIGSDRLEIRGHVTLAPPAQALVSHSDDGTRAVRLRPHCFRRVLVPATGPFPERVA
jgi:hypothetical protein